MILSSEVYQDAWKWADEKLRQSIREVPAGDTLMHSRLIDGIKVLDAIQQYFKSTITTGKQAQIRLAHRNAKGRRV